MVLNLIQVQSTSLTFNELNSMNLIQIDWNWFKFIWVELILIFYFLKVLKKLEIIFKM